MKTTFLSRLDVTKYLLSGLQSHDQMIRLCMAVSFPVCAWSENCGSAGKQQTQTRTEMYKELIRTHNSYISSNTTHILSYSVETTTHSVSDRWSSRQNFVMITVAWHQQVQIATLCSVVTRALSSNK